MNSQPSRRTATGIKCRENGVANRFVYLLSFVDTNLTYRSISARRVAYAASAKAVALSFAIIIRLVDQSSQDLLARSDFLVSPCRNLVTPININQPSGIPSGERTGGVYI